MPVEVAVGRSSRILKTIVLPLVFAGSPAAVAQPQPVVREAITPGSEKEARKYYDALTQEFGVNATVGASLTELLAFTGYPLSAEQLEGLDPEVLMSPGRLASCDGGACVNTRNVAGAILRPDDVLATRFFAPKIACVETAKPNPGWRKLVRLQTRPDSAARKVGIEAAIILFNFFGATGAAAFGGHSVNTQVMLLAPSHKNRLYWMDFDPTGNLSFALSATFDAGLTGCATRQYFVPDGCNACHGSPGNLRPPMVNYLDTDHWFDRLADDFADVTDPLLFDARTNDTSSADFARSFDVIRKFNEETLQQNNLVHPASFETAAVRTWLGNHAATDGSAPPVTRGFSTSPGTDWKVPDADGLGLLNRFCFRCHGSVRFSIFDRPSVVARSANMRQRIKPSAVQARTPGFKMPPDRTLTPEQITALDTFLKNLE